MYVWLLFEITCISLLQPEHKWLKDIGAAPWKMKQRSSNSLRSASLCYSNAKSTLLVTLTFNRDERSKHKNFILFIFFLLLLFLSSFISSFFFARHNSKSIHFFQILNIPNDCSANLLHSYFFWAPCELRMVSYGLKTGPKSIHVFTRTLLEFSHNNCVGVARIFRPHLDYWERAVQPATSLLVGMPTFSNIKRWDYFNSFINQYIMANCLILITIIEGFGQVIIITLHRSTLQNHSAVAHSRPLPFLVKLVS